MLDLPKKQSILTHVVRCLTLPFDGLNSALKGTG
jgi:hypothetical protein